MSGGIRRAVRPPFKHWWLVGGLLVCGLVLAGWLTGWSGGFLAVTAIVTAVYVALPPMESARREMLGGERVLRSPSKAQASAQDHEAGGATVWDQQINRVAHALSNAITDAEVIRDIALKAGLTMQYIRFSSDADTYWTAILERAQDEGTISVDSVLNQALARTENEMVHDSIKQYRKSRGE